LYSAHFFGLGCALDQTPAKNESSRNTAAILNTQVTILTEFQKAKWVDKKVPSAPVESTPQSDLTLEPGGPLTLSSLFRTIPLRILICCCVLEVKKSAIMNS
jgi:hypothetical protein